MAISFRATKFVRCRGLSASRSVRFGRLHCISIIYCITISNKFVWRICRLEKIKIKIKILRDNQGFIQDFDLGGGGGLAEAVFVAFCLLMRIAIEGPELQSVNFNEILAIFKEKNRRITL